MNTPETVLPLSEIMVRDFGLQPYEPIYQKMLRFTDERTEKTPDEIWLLEHEPVYTLGKNGKKHHILNSGAIPIVQVDRGGQVTYHGPGQLIAYLLLDIRRRSLGVRQVVSAMENALIQLLETYSIDAYAKPNAPGVYVEDKKIAALGLRIRKGCSYHGLSLNVSMDTTPFNGINPCGYEGLEVAQLSDFSSQIDTDKIKQALIERLKLTLEQKLSHK